MMGQLLLSNWHESDDLKVLQKQWYSKLKETGFEDIEDTNSPREYLKTWHSSYFHCRYSPESFADKQEYFRRTSNFLHRHKFENILDLEVWSLHAEGFSYREIGRILNIKSTSQGKKSVQTIIKRLTSIMLTMPIQIDCPCDNPECPCDLEYEERT